jgi:hypothetical protein
MRHEDYYHFLDALDKMFGPRRGLVHHWNNARMSAIKDLHKNIDIDKWTDPGQTAGYKLYIAQLKGKIDYVLTRVFTENNNRIDLNFHAINHICKQLSTPKLGPLHVRHLTEMLERHRREVENIVEDEQRQIRQLRSDIEQQMPDENHRLRQKVAALFDNYEHVSHATLTYLDKVQAVLETTGVVQRWVLQHKPDFSLSEKIDGKDVSIEVHFSHDIQPKQIDEYFADAQIALHESAFPEYIKRAGMKRITDLGKGYSAASKFLEVLGKMIRDVLKANPELIMFPHVSYHLLVRSGDRDWPKWAGACYVATESTPSEVLLNIGLVGALQHYYEGPHALRGTLAHELGHMFDQKTCLKHNQATELAHQMVGKDINEYDIFLFQFFNMCRTEGYAEVIANFHRAFSDTHPGQKRFFFFQPFGYGNEHAASLIINYMSELDDFNRFLKMLESDKAPAMFERYFDHDDCRRLRYRFGWLLYLFIIIGRLAKKHKNMVILAEEGFNDLKSRLAQEDEDTPRHLRRNHKALAKYCKEAGIKAIPLKELYDYWLVHNKPVFIYRPQLSEFEEIMKDLHHISSHKLYAEYRKACTALGIPREKMIFSPEQIARVVKVTKATLKKKHQVFKSR